MAQSSFVARVLERVPASGVKDYLFKSWSVPGKATSEGVGLLPVPGADPQKVIARVFDVDRYVGNIGHVTECRAIPDPAHPAPALRFYQRIHVPIIGDVHHELVLERGGVQGGYEIAWWRMLDRETEALSTKTGIRSQYNDGAWLAAPGFVGYALSSCPRREDVGLLKWKTMTTGADVAASKVIRENIEAMARWAARS